MRLTALLISAFFVVASAPSAREVKIELGTEGTTVSFTLGATLHTVHGSFEVTSGSLRLNLDNGAASGTVTVDATSAETGNNKRDKKMHSKVLRTAEYPRIVLHVRRLEGDLAVEGTSGVVLHADMEILGRMHEVAVPITVEIIGGRFIASATFEVPYVDWGLQDPSTFVLRVAKTVTVSVSCEGRIVTTE